MYFFMEKACSFLVHLCPLIPNNNCNAPPKCSAGLSKNTLEELEKMVEYIDSNSLLQNK